MTGMNILQQRSLISLVDHANPLSRRLVRETDNEERRMCQTSSSDKSRKKRHARARAREREKERAHEIRVRGRGEREMMQEHLKGHQWEVIRKRHRQGEG